MDLNNHQRSRICGGKTNKKLNFYTFLPCIISSASDLSRTIQTYSIHLDEYKQDQKVNMCLTAQKTYWNLITLIFLFFICQTLLLEMALQTLESCYRYKCFMAFKHCHVKALYLYAAYTTLCTV